MKIEKPRHSMINRLLHWTYAPAVLAAIASGFYIHKPSPFWGFKSMDSARKTHFISTYILAFSYLARFYSALWDKNYRELLPSRRTLAALPGFVKYELFLTKKKPEFPKYNPGQKFLITSLAILLPLLGVTGLPLYAVDAWQKQPPAVTGGLNPPRKIHYLTGVATTALIAPHIYFSVTDSLAKLKSIFTGYK
ncbi:MAG: cytochrome b/b6 domain-containing protein [Armatimonadetes bacterium]|nr:cytochrome b/b6 domain-containing protein [Armatimonadota bacterium]